MIRILVANGTTLLSNLIASILKDESDIEVVGRAAAVTFSLPPVE